MVAGQQMRVAILRPPIHYPTSAHPYSRLITHFLSPTLASAGAARLSQPGSSHSLFVRCSLRVQVSSGHTTSNSRSVCDEFSGSLVCCPLICCCTSDPRFTSSRSSVQGLLRRICTPPSLISNRFPSPSSSAPSLHLLSCFSLSRSLLASVPHSLTLQRNTEKRRK